MDYPETEELEFFDPDADHEDEANFQFRNNAAVIDATVMANELRAVGVDEALIEAAKIAVSVKSLLGDADAFVAESMTDIMASLRMVATEFTHRPERAFMRALNSLSGPERTRAIARARKLLDELDPEPTAPDPEPAVRTTSARIVLGSRSWDAVAELIDRK